jgi:phosphopantothenoylcysteine decarboxylase/phosphopantothenate--cysteine ligase
MEPTGTPERLDGAVVVLGVSGGIAAYKAVELCRRLVDAGAHVAPVLTEAATRFVGVTTFSALASEPARTELFDSGEPIPHTRLGQRADIVVVAPATARVIGELTAGIAADLLGAVLLATRAPVLLCPAMHTEMWEHPAVQENLATLRRRGVFVVSPGHGRLAGGDVGAGRLAEPVEIMGAIRQTLAGRAAREADGTAVAGHQLAGQPLAGQPRTGQPPTGQPRTGEPCAGDLAGVRVLVTAGGTREPIDPVRFIGNRSSGKQGHAIAEVALERGASVTLVSTVELPTSPGIVVRPVETAAEMADAVTELAPAQDVIVMAAAVADFRPKVAAPTKLHKADGVPHLLLEPTTDILAGLGMGRRHGQVLVGFAAETGGDAETVARAAAKLESKGLDLIVANDVGAPGAGFGHDTNAVTILGRDGSRRDIGVAPKRTIAGAVLDAVIAWRDLAAVPGGPAAASEHAGQASGAGSLAGQASGAGSLAGQASAVDDPPGPAPAGAATGAQDEGGVSPGGAGTERSPTGFAAAKGRR